MQVIALLSQKGGAGKSTLARQLACLAPGALLVDRDPQGTTRKWWDRRQEHAADRPELLDLSGAPLSEAARRLKGQAGTLLIDTRPAIGEAEAEAARVADLVVVPVRPTSDDLEAVGDTLRIVHRLGKRAAIVVNAAKNAPRADAARAALSRWPVAVCPTHLTDRAVYPDAAMQGRAVGEMKAAGAREAHAEVEAVWAFLQEVAADA